MANQTQQSKSAAAAAKPKFSDMSTGDKMKHVGKVIIFVISFGFAFPSLFSD